MRFYSVDAEDGEGRRLVGTVVPAVPVWEVFYDEDKDDLVTYPVLFFTVWEVTIDTAGEAIMYAEIYPVSFGRNPDWVGEANTGNMDVHGLSLTPTPGKEDPYWSDAIDLMLAVK